MAARLAVTHIALPGSTFAGFGVLKFLAFASLARQRRALAKLDDGALNDMGLTRAEAEAEANRPFWDVPNHWRG